MPMKAEREMNPIVVVVTGPTNARAEVAARLTGRLFRRGFRVRALHDSRESFSEAGDFLLVPCDMKEVERLAKRLEGEWTDRWLTWYATQKRPSGVTRKDISRGRR